MDLDSILNEVEVWQPLDETLAWQPKSDLGNAERLKARFGDDLLYVDNIGWHAWDGRRWNRDMGDAQALLYSHQTALAIRGEVRALEALLARWLADDTGSGDGQGVLDPGMVADRLDRLIRDPKELVEARKPVAALARWGVESGNSGRSDGLLKQAAPYLRVAPEAMDASSYLFNAANCALDLDANAASGAGNPDDTSDAGDGDPVRARPHARGDRCSLIGGVDYDPDADAPLWRKFLVEILPDAALRTFLQRVAGYCLTGDTSEQAFLVAYGEGSNGKSTLLETLRLVFGDYGATVDMNSFLHSDRQRGSDATPDFARLPGKRFATAAEINPGDRLAEKTVKTITGGEAMTARQLHKPFFEFHPVFKLILSCNVKPVIRGQDKGIWRRVMLLPFEQSFDKDRIDKHLVDKLRAEGPGILNWCLDGYRQWREGGLAVPDAVLVATESYRTDSDPVGEFLATAIGPSIGHNIQATDLYGFYVRWAKVNGVAPISATGFGKRAKQRLRHEKIGVQFYCDIQIMESALRAVEDAEAKRPPDDNPPPPEGDL